MQIKIGKKIAVLQTIRRARKIFVGDFENCVMCKKILETCKLRETVALSAKYFPS